MDVFDLIADQSLSVQALWQKLDSCRAFIVENPASNYDGGNQWHYFFDYYNQHPISAIRCKVLEIYEAVVKELSKSWFDDEYTRISRLIKDNDQSAILYLKILWKQGKLSDAKSFIEKNERGLFEMALSEGSTNQMAKNLALLFDIGCSSVPQLLCDLKSLPIRKLNEVFKQLIAINERFQFESTSSNITIGRLVNMLSSEISTEDEVLKILILADDFVSSDKLISTEITFEDQQFLRELIFEKLSRFEFNNEKMLNFVHQHYSKMQSKSFEAFKKIISKLNEDDSLKIFKCSIKILDDSARRVSTQNNLPTSVCGSITGRFGTDELPSETDNVIYHLKIVSLICSRLHTENKCESKKQSCESKCSDASCNVHEAGDAKIDAFPTDANFFELIGHENSQIRNLVYHLADKYDLKQTQNVRNEMVMLLKLKEMMDIDESKCCPQAVRSELEFQDYLIQFIQQFCYLGLEMKLPIPYEKAILIYEAFGQIKEKQPIPELILEFITMEIEIFSKEEIQLNQPQIPHKWKILKVLYEILAMFSQVFIVDNAEAQSIIKIFKTNLTRVSCRSEFQLSRERTGFHTFLKQFGIKSGNIMESNILHDFENEIISEYESGKLVNSEGTVYMIWSVVFASQGQCLAKITGILYTKFEVCNMKSLQPDAACLDMNLASEMLRFPQSNTRFLEKSLLYSISAIGCDLMSIKNAAQNLFSTAVKMLFKDSLTLASLSTNYPDLMKIMLDSLDDKNSNKTVVSLLILRQCRQSRHFNQTQELISLTRNLFKSKIWRVRSLAAETFYNLRILPTKVLIENEVKHLSTFSMNELHATVCMLNFIKKNESNKSLAELLSSTLAKIATENCPEIIKLEINKVKSDSSNENTTCDDPCEILFENIKL